MQTFKGNPGVTGMHTPQRKEALKNTYFFVTVFLPLTNFVDVDVDRKLAVPWPLPPPPPPLNDILE